MKSNTDKKKQFDKIIKSGTDIIEMPPYQMSQINGIVIKTFPFLRIHDKLNDQQIHWGEEYPQKDYAILVARKNELENQINLNREYCAKISDSVRWRADEWLKHRFSLVDPDKLECQPLKDFALAVRAVIDGATHGFEIESIKNRMQKRNFKTTLEIGSVTLDANSLLPLIEKMINKIEGVISRSVDLYVDYVELHGILYDFDVDKFFAEQQQKVELDKIDLWIQKNIPNSPNKDTYKEVFEIVEQHPEANMIDYSAAYFLNYVHKKLTPDISDESLRKKIPEFVRDLPL